MIRRGFTLIELLIVVAIIAILAAIAVPNFLEAQTRAKISRCKADFQAYGTAIETYAIDHGPKYQNICHGVDTRAHESWVLWRFKNLTTPISYISSIARDPFIPAGANSFIIPTELDQTPSYVYTWYDKSNTFSRVQEMPNYEIPGHPNYPGFNLCIEGPLHDKQWMLVSQGPKYVAANPEGTPSRLLGINQKWRYGPYEATNGTMSYGLIVRHN